MFTTTNRPWSRTVSGVTPIPGAVGRAENGCSVDKRAFMRGTIGVSFCSCGVASACFDQCRTRAERRRTPMRRKLLGALAVAVLLAFTVAPVVADEAVVLSCSVNAPGAPASVFSCDRSFGVPVTCPPAGASCAQTVASFLAFDGYKVVSVQPLVFGLFLYTIIGPSGQAGPPR